MRFNNIVTKKENIEYFSGDVLIMYNETMGKVEAYMVSRNYNKYNILNLNSGETYYSGYNDYDDFVRDLEERFTSIEAIDNDELELVRVED